MIILTGVHNSLRSQTQVRIIDEILGYDNDKAMRMEHVDRKVGVGKYPDHFKNGYVQSLTTSNEKGDFKKGVATTVGYSESDPYVLVVKKTSRFEESCRLASEHRRREGEEEGESLPSVIDDEVTKPSTPRGRGDPDTGTSTRTATN